MPRITPPIFSARRAFTLVEVVMVMLIMTFVGAMALPRWANGTARYRVDLAAQRIVADLLYAQSRANYSSTPVTLTFSTTSNSYQIVGLADPDHPSATYTVNLATEPYRAVLSSAVFGNSTAITFDGFGKPAAGGTVVLTVGTRQHTITVEATSGKAVIQ